MIDFKSVLGTLLEFGPGTVGVAAHRPCREPAGRRPRLDPEQPGRRSGRRWPAAAISVLSWAVCSATPSRRPAIPRPRSRPAIRWRWAASAPSPGPFWAACAARPPRARSAVLLWRCWARSPCRPCRRAWADERRARAGLAEAAPTSAPVGGYQEAAMETVEDDASAELLLRAMINAAKADGQIDGTEMNNILSKLDEAGAGQEAKDFVLAEMRRPLDLDSLVAGVRTPAWRPRSMPPRPWRSRSTPRPSRTTWPSWRAASASRRRSAPASTPAWASGAPSSAIAPGPDRPARAELL